MGTFMTVQEHRSKIRDMYTFISERLYFNRPDLSVQGESANATLLLSLLTALIGGSRRRYPLVCRSRTQWEARIPVKTKSLICVFTA